MKSQWGNCTRFLTARRRIPAHAFGLKEYFAGTSRVSKTSDNEDATAALWNSQVLSVKHAPGDAIPEFAQRPDDGSHVPPSVRRQKSRDVFEQKPTGSAFTSDTHDFPEEP
jgi:hypothetical protein